MEPTWQKAAPRWVLVLGLTVFGAIALGSERQWRKGVNEHLSGAPLTLRRVGLIEEEVRRMKCDGYDQQIDNLRYQAWEVGKYKSEIRYKEYILERIDQLVAKRQGCNGK